VARECFVVETPNQVLQQPNQPPKNSTTPNTAKQKRDIVGSQTTFLLAKLGDKHQRCILDSGSEASIVPSSVVAACRLQMTMMTQKLKAANCSEIKVIGETTLELGLDDITVLTAKCLVSEFVDEVILGLNWMRVNKVVCSFHKGQIHLRGRTFVLYSYDAVRQIAVKESKVTAVSEVKSKKNDRHWNTKRCGFNTDRSTTTTSQRTLSMTDPGHHIWNRRIHKLGNANHIFDDNHTHLPTTSIRNPDHNRSSSSNCRTSTRPPSPHQHPEQPNQETSEERQQETTLHISQQPEEENATTIHRRAEAQRRRDCPPSSPSQKIHQERDAFNEAP